MKANKAQ